MRGGNILVVSGSPKKDGNTSALVEWFSEGARSRGASVEVVNAALLASKINGCQSCRACQEREQYGCIFDDGVGQTLAKMAAAAVIVMATPLYFFSASAQLKRVFDRMFSLYKWDNDSGTMKTVLKGKTLAVIASAFEAEGFDALEKPFIMTARYTAMEYSSLTVPNAGVSGDLRNNKRERERALAFGKLLAGKALRTI